MRFVSAGLVAIVGFSIVGGCSGSERKFGTGGAGASGAAGAAGAAGKPNTSEGGRAGGASAGTAGAEPEAGSAGDSTDGGTAGTVDETGGTTNGGSTNGGAGAGGKAGGGSGSGGAAAGAGGGSAGAPPTCNACANGFACSTTTCKTTCSVDSDCLGDHFCSSGQCRLDAVQVSIGYSHACVLLADKTVSCWGSNQQSQLGSASAADSATPVPVKFLSNVQAIAVGDALTFALLNDGTVVYWGTRITKYEPSTNQYTTVASQYPTPLDGLSAVKTIAAGGRGNGCATLADGSARCWNFNDMGQLGNGTYNFSVDPVVVSGVSGATSIDFGYAFACAQSTSAVKCWGNNFDGNLGSFADTTSNTPQTITGLTGTVSKLRTGDSFGCVLMTNGSMQCWGANGDGQLGNGTSGTKATTPVTVTAVPNVADLQAGTTHTCALQSGGTVRCWGQNYDGQIGNGNKNSPVTMPTAVTGITGAIALGVGSYTSCVILTNGSVKCWGRIVGESSNDYSGATTVW